MFCTCSLPLSAASCDRRRVCVLILIGGWSFVGGGERGRGRGEGGVVTSKQSLLLSVLIVHVYCAFHVSSHGEDK